MSSTVNPLWKIPNWGFCPLVIDRKEKGKKESKWQYEDEEEPTAGDENVPHPAYTAEYGEHREDVPAAAEIGRSPVWLPRLIPVGVDGPDGGCPTPAATTAADAIPVSFRVALPVFQSNRYCLPVWVSRVRPWFPVS